MFRRPRSDETEEDLLQMQLELQASSEFVPAAQVVRIGHQSKVEAPVNTEERWRLNSRVTTIEDGVVERQVDASVNVEPPRHFAQAEPFPKALRRSEQPTAPVAKGTDPKKRSIFAQQLAAKRATTERALPATVSDINAAQSAIVVEAGPTTINTTQQHADPGPSGFESESVLSRIPQRVVSTKEIEKIHSENAQYLSSFSETELLEERKRLLETLGQSTVAFLRSLRDSSRATKAVESETEVQKQNSEPFNGPTAIVHGTCCGLHEEREDGVVRLEVAGGRPTIVDCRSGVPRADAESYTLEAICRLTRSAIAQQRSFAFILLRRAWSAAVAAHDDSAMECLVTSDLVTLARRALDDSTAQCVVDGVSLAHAVAQCATHLLADRVMRRMVAPVGMLRFYKTLPSGEKEADTSSGSESDDEERVNDNQLAKCGQVTHVFVTRMRLAARLAFLVRDANLHGPTSAETRERAYEMACVAAAHCPKCAQKIYDERLFDYLLAELDFNALRSAELRFCRLAALVGDLFIALSSASRRICQRLAERHELLERVFMPLLGALCSVQRSVERVVAQRSVCDAVTMMVAYDVASPNFAWLGEALRDALGEPEWHAALVHVCQAMFAAQSRTESEGLFDLSCTQLLSLVDEFNTQSTTQQMDLVAQLLSAIATFGELFAPHPRFLHTFGRVWPRLLDAALDATLDTLPILFSKLIDVKQDDVHVAEQCAVSVSLLTASLRLLHAACSSGDSAEHAQTSLVRRVDSFARLLHVVQQCGAHESLVPYGNAVLVSCDLFLRIVTATDVSPEVVDFVLSLLTQAHANRSRLHFYVVLVERCLRLLLRPDSLRVRVSCKVACDTALQLLDEQAAMTCYLSSLTDGETLREAQRCIDVSARRDTFFLHNASSAENDVHWCVAPLLGAYQHRANGSENDARVAVQSSLSMLVLLDAVGCLTLTPRTTVVYTLLAYLVGTDCYLEEPVRRLVAHLVACKVPHCTDEPESPSPVQFNLATAYNELLSQYEAASYNDATFANCVLLLPFALHLPNAETYRRLLVVHNLPLFRALPLYARDMLVPLSTLLSDSDIETEADILEAYGTLVLAEKPRCSLVYVLCVQRLNATLYAPALDSDVLAMRFCKALFRRLAQATNAGQTAAVRDLLLYDRTDEAGQIVQYTILPEARATRLRTHLRSAQLDTTWLTDVIYDELTLKFLLEFI